MGGEGGAVHFTAEHLSTLLSIELNCTYFPCSALHYKVKKSRIRETTNLSTDADRHTDTERNIKDFLLLRGIWLGGGVGGAVHFTAEHLSTLLSIELHCTHFPCSALYYKVNN